MLTREIFFNTRREISYLHAPEWNNCFVKNAQKGWRILPDLFVKTTDFQLVFNFEQTRTVTIFGEHGIMAHIPWWLSQSDL